MGCRVTHEAGDAGCLRVKADAKKFNNVAISSHPCRNFFLLLCLSAFPD